MRSKPTSIVLLSMLVVLAVGVSASAANATALFEWKVKGSALKSESSKEFTLKNKSKETFHITLALGNGLENPVGLTSTSVKLVPTDKESIVGGKPGKVEMALEFQNLELEEKELNTFCKVKGGKIVTYPLVGEIVENAEAKKGRGVVELLLQGQGVHGFPEEWSLIEFEGVDCFLAKREFNLHGGKLIEMSPQKAEAKIGNLLFETEATKNSNEYVNSKGEFKTAQLRTNTGGGARLTGEPEIELVSKEAFGAF
jgi:hypothetical protein